MPKVRRVVFSFDDKSLESLKRLTEQGRIAPTLPKLQEYDATEYREVEITNPETGEKRVICIPKI